MVVLKNSKQKISYCSWGRRLSGLQFKNIYKGNKAINGRLIKDLMFVDPANLDVQLNSKVLRWAAVYTC